ncbi:hypothetical protein AYO49_02620 [Verrucomicrobiaceae bacterium SCGC AG-212-N21]|nr:hypothetical protein AYO49_02620 [Verrucomicrobiaceae bacterium SCGC AG-212-N21]
MPQALLGVMICLISSCGKEGGVGEQGAGDSSNSSSAAGSETSSGSGSKASAPVEKPEPPLGHPASAVEAGQKVDFTTFPLMEGATDERSRSLAHLTYRVAADVKSAYEFQKKQLMAQKWKELPEGAAVTPEYASATFSRAGFHVSVMVMPHSEAGKVDVTLRNHGNVELAKLPRPKTTKAVYEGPVSAIYTAEGEVPAAIEECEKLLLADGWQPYGMEGDQRVYKKNAMAVKVWVTPAPAQGNKTSITYSSQQMSGDVPMMPGAERFRISESTGRWDFETKASEADVAAYYRKALEELGWKATLDKTIEINGKNMVIFRNEPKDMITLEMQNRFGSSNVSLLLQSATTVAEIDQKLNAQAEARKAKMKAEAAKPAVVFVPADATVVSQTSNEIKFTIGEGKARALSSTWSDKYYEAGWLLERGGYEGGKGKWAFKREGQTLVFVYTDEGGAPAEITVTSTGVALERGGAQ